ncbi:hypothetical protein HZH66_009493 [Vespula vulgaris]|uniref:Uncharacterized protein n=2 Tax=Vespula vulgaris TaxID=7454 RepID=A0A834JLX1_VESVU|nr:uncharacterized protein LOC127066430 isoform X1 [Vespula vulgaris]KAF7391013.1 hypothetical protein HZH66_009493 [Vespula vulgaris]
MTRIIAISVRTIFFCVFADVVCGSQNYYWNNARTRFPKHASCTSCNRDWADTLSSPWYPRQNYEEVPNNREYLDFAEKSYNEWVPSSPMSTSYSLNKYEHPSRNGGDDPTDVAISGTGNPYQHEDSFEDRESQRFDPYLASKTSTASLSQEGTLNQHPFMLMTNSDNNNRLLSRNYRPQKFHEFGDHSIRNVENNQEYKVDRSNRMNEILYRKVQSLSQENTKDYQPSKKFLVVYRADQNENSFELEDDSADVFRESRIPPESLEEIDESVSYVDSNSFFRHNPSENKIIDSMPFVDRSKLFLKEQNKHNNYYDLLKKSNIPKTVRFIDRDQLFPDRKEIASFWQFHRDKSSESLTPNKDYKAKESTKDGSFFGQHDITNNEKEKLFPMEGLNMFNMEHNATKGTFLKFDPDILDDIENPPTEPTEPITMSESTESSMMTEN